MEKTEPDKTVGSDFLEEVKRKFEIESRARLAKHYETAKD